MATKSQKRAKDIESKVKNLESLKKGKATAANSGWIKGAEQVNAKLTTRVAETQERLWDHQRAAMMFWPIVEKPLKDAKVKYRGSESAGNPRAFNDAKRLFSTRYPDMWRALVYDVVEPFNMVTGNGKVLCRDTNGQVAITRAPSELWSQRQMTITAEEFWNAQEDLWMLHSLMQAIARVNEGSVNIDDARIKRLISATLRGGSQADLAERRKKKQGNNPAAAAAQTPGQAGAGGPPIGNIFGGWGSRSESAEAAGAKPLPLIDPDDIFGADTEGGASTAGGTGGGLGKRYGGGEAASANPYVIGETGKWRARGFVLRVVMDHQDIPKLLTELTQSPFPVMIYHVEHQPYDFQKGRQTPQSTGTGGENDPNTKQIKLNEERLKLAMNQVNLAEVLVAGTFTLYDEPAAPAAQASAAPSTTPAASQPAKAAGKAATGAASAKPATPPSASPTAAPATKNSPTATPAKGQASSPAGGASPNASPSPKPASGSAPQAPAPQAPASKSQPARPTKS
jgi:hypothetical protein